MTEIGKIFASAFPDQMAESVRRPVEGNRKRTAIVETGDGERVVIQRSAEPAAAMTEARLAREIATRTAIPVPSVIQSGTIGSTGYQITEYVDGNNLHERFTLLDSADRAQIAREFGRALGSLHATFEFDRFGDVTVTDGGLEAIGERAYEEWFRRYAEAGIDALPPAFADLREPLRDAIRSASLPETRAPRLFPWDLRPGNVVVANGRLAAFLDWGDPLAAGAGLSVAKTEYLLADWYLEDGETLRAAFRDGYTSVRSRPEVTRAERLTAVLRSAIDSDGAVTRPGYPERNEDEAIAFHREHLAARL